MKIKLKITAADKWFSLCVRERANFTCEYCGLDLRNFPSLLDCSHFVGKGNNSTRHHPLNAFAHCKEHPDTGSCHAKLGGGRFQSGNPAEFSDHYDKVFGSDNREVRRMLSHVPFKSFKHHEKAISDHYRPIYRAMVEQRKNGFDGRIEFDAYAGSPEMLAVEKDIRKRLCSV